MNRRLLVTGFRNTSSELLIMDAQDYQTLVLPNNKVKDSKLLIETLSREKFGYVISFGQRPNIKNKVHIETTARAGETCIDTNFDCERLKSIFEQNDIVAKISHNTGTSFCNKLYYNGLKYINENALETQMVFVHIPFMKNIDDFDGFRRKILDAIDSIL